MSPAKSFFKSSLFILLILSVIGKVTLAQNISNISGIIVDQNQALIPGVEVTIINLGGTLERTVFTDNEGFFSFPMLPPDQYILKISKDGFDPSEIRDLLVTEGNSRRFKIELKINPVSESIPVEAENDQFEANKSGSATFNRTSVENLPLNGRQPQALIKLVPGIVLTPVDAKNLGQFSSNGQRTNANYFTVDGVSANFGTTNYNFLGQTGSGSIPSTNVQGGLDNLVSFESVDEVKIQTLDFSPANGRMPGANVSFVSRSGGGKLSFAAFENFRHSVFNAKDYFDFEKPPHILNNFGGSLGGPVPFLTSLADSENKAFFFLAFEGKRFTLPQPTVVSEVPSLDIRKDVRNPVAQAVFNSFPLPNDKRDEKSSSDAVSADNPTENISSAAAFFPKTAPFRATYADPNGSESYNLRVDYLFGSKISLFGRFNYSPSFSENRNPANLSAFVNSNQITQTLTFGSAQYFSSKFFNEFRFNLSRQTSTTENNFDGRYGGALPDKALFIPDLLDPAKTRFRFNLNGLSDSLAFVYGDETQNKMRQLFISDSFSYLSGEHDFKFGFDFRRLSPTLGASGFEIDYDFNSVEAVSAGLANRVAYYKKPEVNTKVLTISSFAQNNWKIRSNLNLLYGIRWEINPAVRATDANLLRTLETAPNLEQSDQTGLRLAPAGASYYRTDFRNFAPRSGFAWQVFDQNGLQLILRTGFGLFYDLGQSQFNEIVSPFEHSNDFSENLILPNNDLPPFFLGNTGESRRLAVVAASADYRLPRTYFWNFSAQLKIGNGQLFSMTYVGGAGRFLQRTVTLNMAESGTNSDGYFSDRFSKVIYVDNAFSSDYQSFQFQYATNLSKNLSYFVNYAWSHSTDNNSSDNNVSMPFLKSSVENDRGSSDFDVRHSLNFGFMFELPMVKSNNFAVKILQNWTFGGIFFARTGLPYDVKIVEFNPLVNDYEIRRASVDENLPLFLKSSESPLGTKLNADAFTKPVKRSEQGNLDRNVFSGPSVWQFDASLKRTVNLTDKFQMQFGVEVFNLLNRPNFSNPQTKIFYRDGKKIVPKNFGMPVKSMARGFASDEPTGGLNPVFQLGGARTIQFGVRLKF